MIELLVSVAVIGLLLGVAVPSINTFNKRQTLKNAQEEVKSTLRLAQSKAFASEINRQLCKTPASRPGFFGWYARFANNSQEYTIQGRCVTRLDRNNINPEVIGDFNLRSFKLPQNHTFSDLSESQILVLFRPASPSARFYRAVTDIDNDGPIGCPCPPATPVPTMRVTVKNSAGDVRSITVRSNGEISE